MTKELPSPELLRKLLRYHPQTGKLFWLPRPIDMFPSKGAFKAWNSRFAGQEALTADSGEGYRRGSIQGRYFLSHRVVWVLNFGFWPSGHIDHINGDKADNRIENLRDVTQSENLRNAKMRSHNKSGHNGVCWHNGIGKWVSRIHLHGKQINLGSFSNIDDAIAARKNAEIGRGYTQRHGEPQ